MTRITNNEIHQLRQQLAKALGEVKEWRGTALHARTESGIEINNLKQQLAEAKGEIEHLREVLEFNKKAGNYFNSKWLETEQKLEKGNNEIGRLKGLIEQDGLYVSASNERDKLREALGVAREALVDIRSECTSGINQSDDVVSMVQEALAEIKDVGVK